jgi:3-hydroxybutyryl-CoA dehydrogenase
MQLKTVGVVGAGTMGSGIVEVAAVAGLDVVLVEIDAAQRASAAKRIASSVSRGIQKGKIDAPSAEEVVDRIQTASEISALADCDFVIEAAVENEAVKCRLFAELNETCRPEIILASNTSSISITRLAQASGRPEQVIGMHFFNPVPVMPPVEVIPGLQTSDATVAATNELAERLGKKPLVVKDSPGFAVNRILLPLINEAAFALMEGIADAQTIDELMVLGCNHPMGPLTLADLVGVDVCLFVLEVLHRELGDPKFRPCPLLRRMVDAGHLGRKTGRGFYRYDER